MHPPGLEGISGKSPIPQSRPGAHNEGMETPSDNTENRASLRRNTGDRMIAGVAGGISEHFGIDPVIVRIGFIALTFLGGAGLALYLVGWLAVPRDTSGSIVTDTLGNEDPHRVRGVLAIAAIVAGLYVTVLASRTLFDLFTEIITAAPYLALMLIAAGAALVLWPKSSGAERAEAPKQDAASGAPATVPAAESPSETAAAAAMAAASTAPTPEPAAAASPTAAPVSGAASEQGRKPRRRRRSVTGPLTVAVLLVLAGGVLLLAGLAVHETSIATALAVAVMVAGAGLAVSAFFVPARGLLALGAVLAVPLVLVADTDVSLWSGTGERRVEITSPDDLQDEYRYGIGELVVDMRRLDLAGAARRVDIGLVVGKIRVYVPDSVELVIDADIGAGQFDAWRRILVDVDGSYLYDDGFGYQSGVGIDYDLTFPAAAEPSGLLQLDLDLGLGAVQVVAVPVPS